MIIINRRERALLEHVTSADPNLSRPHLAEVISAEPESVSRLLSRLRRRGLINVTYGPHRRITSITPAFDFSQGNFFVRRTA